MIVCERVHVPVQKSELWNYLVSSIVPYLIFRDRVSSLIWLGWLASQPPQYSCVCLSSQDWADRHVLPRLLFSPVGSSDLTQALVLLCKVCCQWSHHLALFVCLLIQVGPHKEESLVIRLP